MAKKSAKKSASGQLVAKKDFHLHCPPHIDLKIKKGDDLSKVEERFLTNLKTEGVL